MAWMVHLTLGSHSLALLLHLTPLAELWKIHSLPRMSYVLYKTGVENARAAWMLIICLQEGNKVQALYFVNLSIIRRNAIFKVLLFMIISLSIRITKCGSSGVRILKWSPLLIIVRHWSWALLLMRECLDTGLPLHTSRAVCSFHVSHELFIGYSSSVLDNSATMMDSPSCCHNILYRC